MLTRINPNSGLPTYLQIINQVKYLVASGRLRPGDELPPIRSLAEQLLINPNTVARAYRDLESAGLVVSRVGSGTRVTDGASPLARKERMRILTSDVDALLAQANQLGFNVDEVVELLQRRHVEMRDNHREDGDE